MSLRTRILAAITLVTVAALAVSSTVVSVAVGRTEQQQLDEALRLEAARESRAASAGTLEAITEDAVSPSADDVAPAHRFAVLYDDGGHVRAATPELRGRAPTLASIRHAMDAPFDATLLGQSMRCILVPVRSTPGSTLLLAAPRSDLDGDVRFLFKVHAVVFVLAVVFASLVARWIARRLTRDLQRIERAAQRVSGGDLSVRVGLPARNEEISRLAANVDDMIAKLETLVGTQTRFIANAAHELRSPLTALYGELSLALRRERESSFYRQTIEEALSATEHLVRLAEDLLALARLSADRNGTRRDAVSMLGVSRAALATTESLAQRRGVRVVQSGDDREVSGSAADLERMVRNLVENAVRISPNGGEVRVALQANEDWVDVSVADDGPGIASDERARIFEPFYRGRSGEKSGPGAGLGLAIVREIARAHGGDVEVSGSDSRSGATFVVRLPRSRMHSTSAPDD